ncbi:hypothetical protein F4703DRAFT_1842018 [Phycomyces blakesleeanus]
MYYLAAIVSIYIYIYIHTIIIFIDSSIIHTQYGDVPLPFTLAIKIISPITCYIWLVVYQILLVEFVFAKYTPIKKEVIQPSYALSHLYKLHRALEQ